jgi:plasmid stabilization system protein ParE
MENRIEKFSVKITETAWGQMIEHARFLANVSVEAANRLVDEFVERTNTLSQMPERCPWLTHDDLPFQKYRKLNIGKYHLALYTIRGNTVYVSAVVDSRQDNSWLL